MEIDMNKIIVRRSQLKSVVGLSPSSVERLEKAGDFPRRRKFGPGTIGWLYEEIVEWAREKGGCEL
jgi:prophage regulatory protein